MADIDFGSTYTILEQLGSGSGGTVYKAYHNRLKKEVALKKIHSDLEDINVRTETDILKNIKHQFLPQILDFLEIDDGIYTVMEYISGKSFKEYLDEGIQFEEKDIIIWFKQLCEALEVLHKQHPPIIHGDIKPSNIMLTSEGQVCLIDFNISSFFMENQTTVSGYTPGYAAPEQIEAYEIIRKIKRARFDMEETELMDVSKNKEANGGKKVEEQPIVKKQYYPIRVDARADIYSLGATIYRMISGQKPKIKDGKVIEIQKICPHINPVLAHIIMTCVEVEPEKRYQDIGEVHKALTNIYRSQDRFQRLVRRQKVARLGMLVGVVGFSLLAGSGFVKIQQEHSLAYQNSIEAEANGVDISDETAVEQNFESAIEIYPDRSEPYEIKAQYLLNKKDYIGCEQFLIESSIPYVSDDVGLCNLYMLLGECYINTEDYSAAMEAYAKAIDYDSENASAYGNYAVALARVGKIDQAEEELESAISSGLDKASIYYTYGELNYAGEEWKEADAYFEKCLEHTNDSYMRERAVLMRLNILDQMSVTKENCEKKLEIIVAPLSA